MSFCSKDIDYQRVSTFFWTPLYIPSTETTWLWHFCKLHYSFSSAGVCFGQEESWPSASATVKLHALDRIMFTYTVKILVAAASVLLNARCCPWDSSYHFRILTVCWRGPVNHETWYAFGIPHSNTVTTHTYVGWLSTRIKIALDLTRSLTLDMEGQHLIQRLTIS
jgi:hypothetical protein